VTLAAPQDIAEFKLSFHADWFDAVALSISTERHLDAVSKAVAELQVSAVNPNLQIFVGGPQACLAPEKLSWPGTHLINANAQQAVVAVMQKIDKAHRQLLLTSAESKPGAYAGKEIA
jgi:hypothetical protein